MPLSSRLQTSASITGVSIRNDAERQSNAGRFLFRLYIAPSMADDTMCATWCNQCSLGDSGACQGVAESPQCKKACPPWLRDMGKAFDDPLQSALEGFVSAEGASASKDDGDADASGAGAGAGADESVPDRDSQVLQYAAARAAGREAQAPSQFANREDVWGGGLRRMVDGGVGPRREDEHYYAPRYVPVGFARYEDPTVDPANYKYYLMSGWRVAIPRTIPGPAVRALLLRIYQYGPRSAGYARLGDTLVPAILGPGDRQTLAQTESRYGPASRKYPLA